MFKDFKLTLASNFKINLIFVVLISWFLSILLLDSFKLGIVILIISASLILIICAVALFKEKTAFLWLIFFFPLLPFHLGFDPFPGLIPVFRIHRILVAFMLIFWIIKSKSIKESIKNFPFTTIFIVFLLSMIISSILSSYKISSFFYVISFCIEYYLFSVMFFDSIQEYKNFEKIFKVIAISSLLAAIMGLVEYFTGGSIYSLIKPFRVGMSYVLTQQIRSGSLRIKGAFDHAITFGVYLSLSLVAVSYLYYFCKSKLKKLFYSITFIIVSSAILLTGSRVAISFYLVLILTIFVLKMRKQLLFFVSICLFVLVQPFFFRNISDKIIFILKSSFMPLQYGTTEMVGSAMMRLEQINYLQKFIHKRLFFGYGHVSNLFFGLKSIDNYYISLFLYFGVVGLISFLLLLFFVLIKSYSLCLRGDSDEVKFLGASMVGVTLGMIIAFLAVSLESHFFLLWIYIGLIAYSYRKQKTGSLFIK